MKSSRNFPFLTLFQGKFQNNYFENLIKITFRKPSNFRTKNQEKQEIEIFGVGFGQPIY